jgi:transcriptional regulator with XRE-family HTH domain
LVSPQPHPAKAVLALHRVSVLAVSRALGFSYTHVSRTLNGHVAATPRFRQRLSALLNVPEADLFRPAAATTSRSRYPGDARLGSVPDPVKATTPPERGVEVDQRRYGRHASG